MRGHGPPDRALARAAAERLVPGVARSPETSSRPGLAVMSFAALTLLAALSIARGEDDPFGASWPEGEGRELTGAWCGGCHSLNLVHQQGMSRTRWDELLHWMTEQQNMPPLEGERRDTVLDYLATHFGVDNTAARGTGEGGRLPKPVPVQGIAREPLGVREGEG